MTRFTAAITAGRATASASFSVRRWYGFNAHVTSTVTPSLTGATFVKSFVYNVGVPAVWPGTTQQPVPAGAQTLVCFLPPPGPLLAGSLDSQLRAYLAGAPAGSWLTAWQEGNDPSNPFWSQPGVTRGQPSQLAKVDAYLATFCAKNAPHVLYGRNFGSSPIYGAGQDCTTYTVPGLPWYSFDGYDRPRQNSSGQWISPHTAAEVFAGIGQVRAKFGPQPMVAITETNTQRVTEDPASAGQWFTDVYQVAQQQGCVLYCTWWGPPGTTDPNWAKIVFTAGAPYVATLNAISADCAA